MNKHIEQIQALNLAFAATEHTLTIEIGALTLREQKVRSQLLSLEQKTVQEMAEQVEREHTLNQQLHAGQQEINRLNHERMHRQKVHTEQSNEARQELESLLKTQSQREREVSAQLLAMQLEATSENVDMAHKHIEQERLLLRQQYEREKVHSQQLLTQQERLRHLRCEQSKREQFLLDGHSKTKQQVEGLRCSILQREREVFTRLQADQRQNAQKKAEQLQLKKDWVLLEQALDNQIASLQSETEALHRTQHLQMERHNLEAGIKVDQQNRLLKHCVVLEAQLKAEMQTGQETRTNLHQLLKELQHSLDITHTSLSWRITAPLRKLMRPFALNKNRSHQSNRISQQVSPGLVVMKIAVEPSPITISETYLKQLAPPLIQKTSLHMPLTASTLAELLDHHDRRFVQCAYHTLLHREPDDQGMTYYLDRLRKGYSKMQLVAQLCLSKEGKTQTTQLTGLALAIQDYRRAQNPFLGIIFKWLKGTEGDGPIERKLRSISNQIFLLNDDNNHRFNQLETTLTSLHNLVVQQTQAIVVDLGGKPKNSLNFQINSTIQPQKTDGLKQLSPRARDIYLQLKIAAAIHTRRIT